jgi:hypothetical protein
VRLVEGFTHLEGHQECEVVATLPDEVEHRAQDVRSGPRRGRRPRGGRLDGGVERQEPVGRAGVGHVGEDVAGAWIEHGKDGRGGRRDPTPADQQLARNDMENGRARLVVRMNRHRPDALVGSST